MQTETARPTINIDIFSRPVMKEAERMLCGATPKDHYEADRLKRLHQFNLNESAHLIENALVALGVYPSIEAANNGCFHLDIEKNLLEVHGDDHETVINTLSISEYPTLVPLFEDIKAKTEAIKQEAITLQAEYTAVHAEAWNMVYTDLVTMGIFPSLEEVKKHKFTFEGGRFLRYTKPSNRLREMISEMFNDN